MTPVSNSMLSAADETEALEQLHRDRCTDGLPVIVPTRERVERMVLAGGLDEDLVVGVMGPQNGAATVLHVAVNAVMAGCMPDYFPVALAAVRAVCQPDFDLAEVQGTTHAVAPLIIVNGPARDACGLASGAGLMGPGHRANASIGRALRLCMMNIGGGLPGISDMALHGHPAKFTFCVAEDEESSPFPPLHTGFGYAAEQSVLTVVGVEGPHSVIFNGDLDDPERAEKLLHVLAAVIANQGSNNVRLGGISAVVVMLNPDHAEMLACAGLTREDVQRRLSELAVQPRTLLAWQNSGYLVGDEDMLPAVRDPANILLLTAGGRGVYTMVMPSWCAGAHENVAVHQAFEMTPFCEIPTV
ncbi:MAG: hypothetical protein HOH66_00640 [Rhodospirillaceae bacterium]|jgi:hypothetical protein|nr:hypothetical protein [Rhodospirillaceae bacterium]MBT6116356.1 hypothetical protein [Rhodospirillaceae bacterium]